MFNNSRDALGIALMYLGCSLNTTDRDELRQAADLIIAGKPVYQGIWMDQILEEAAGRGDRCCALLQRRRGHDDRRESRSRVLRPEGGHEPVRGRDVHSEEREERGGCGEVHQLHVLDRGGDGELGIPSAIPVRIRAYTNSSTRRPETIRCTSRTRAPTHRRAYTNLPKDISQYYNDLWVDIGLRGRVLEGRCPHECRLENHKGGNA